MKRKLFFLFILILICSTVFANAFFNSELKVLSTKYFDIIYPEESKEAAKLLYENADNYYEILSQKYKLEQVYRFPVTLIPSYDSFNAYFSTYGYNRIVMFDTRCNDEMLVYKDDFLKVFYHELTHAINYNIRNKFWYGFRKVFGDNSIGASFVANTAMAEGTAVLEESSTGEGRLNSEYANHIFKQSLIENVKINYSDIPGVRDVYPSDLQYKFGSKFYQWVHDKYGEEKFTEFWHRCVNVKNLTYTRAFKKAFGVSIKKAWKEFIEEQNFAQVNSEPWQEEEVDLVFNEKYVSRYSDLIKVKDGFIFYDKYKNDILYTELLQNSQMQFSKPKKLLSFSSVENISVSSDYKYLAIDYYDKNKTLPKLKTKIYDLETKKLFSVSEEGISDSVILSWEGNHYLATVKVVSQFISTKIYKIEKDEKGNIKNINFVNEFDKEFGKNKFSLCDGGNGNLLFLYKDGLDFSIKLYNIKTKKQKEIKMLSEDTVLQDISCFDNKIYFSYTQKGTMPRLGIIDLNNFDENNSIEEKLQAKFLTKDFSGGFYNPIILNEDKIIYIASFFNHQRILQSDLSKLSFENVELNVIDVTNNQSNDIQNYISESNLNIKDLEKKYNPFNFLFVATIIPSLYFPTYKFSEQEDSLEIASETGIGFTLSTLSPYDSYSLDFSLGYIPQSGSGSANFKIYGNAPTDLWSYSLSSSLEFDKFGFKQTYNELSGSYILSGYNSSYLGFGNSASIFYGRQFSVAEEYLSFIENFTTPFYSSTKYDMTDRLLVYNQSRIGVGISRKEGINIFETFETNLFLNVDIFYNYNDSNKDKNLFCNFYPSVKLKVPRLLPIPSTTVGCFGLPTEFNFAVLPTSKKLINFSTNIKLIDIEIQKSISWFSVLYLNRFFIDVDYNGKILTIENDNNSSYEFTKHFYDLIYGNFNYCDELKLGFSLESRIGLGNLPVVPIILKYNFVYRFFPEKNQRYFDYGFSITSRL